MQISTSVDFGGVFEGLDRLLDFTPVYDALDQSGELMRAAQAQYPTQWTHPMIPPLTDKARRYLMAMLAQGTIQIPYSRTYALDNSWQVERNGLTVTVGTPMPLAPLMKSERMTTFHRITGWEAAPVTGLRVSPQIYGYVNRAVGQMVG